MQTIIKWKTTNVPKKSDRTIIRWHKIYKCPLAVIWRPDKETRPYTPWVDATLCNSWPEESFIPKIWANSVKEPNWDLHKNVRTHGNVTYDKKEYRIINVDFTKKTSLLERLENGSMMEVKKIFKLKPKPECG